MNAPHPPMPMVDTGLPWQNRFHQLGPSFFTPLAPQPINQPYWVGQSSSAANALGLEPNQLPSDALLQALSGNWPISGTQPLASVYSGHQFGNWAGQLGDGRAILLGEVNGFEVQLKGSGLTPYSRMGDGRAVLRSSIREFLCSEAMQALGIPTTRGLCVTGSDDQVWRETPESIAVVTRMAPSFIRFGHFEHFAANNQMDALRTLADHVITRHYPNCKTDGQSPGNVYAGLLACVVNRTALTMAHWQAAGFCHGVMNTDNMSILGLTIDYGPFQFLDAYDPAHICNHTDRGGRYAFGQQPSIAHWNLYALAHALMPLIRDQGLALAALDRFKPEFERHWRQMMQRKLGLTGSHASGDKSPAQDQTLTDQLMPLLAQNHVDYTIFWRRLSHAVRSPDFGPVRDLFLDPTGFDSWLLQYKERITHMEQGPQADLMLTSNPKYVLRNYLAEIAIQAAKEKDFSIVANLLRVLEHPFDEHPAFEAWAGFPPEWASAIEVSCSS